MCTPIQTQGDERVVPGEGDSPWRPTATKCSGQSCSRYYRGRGEGVETLVYRSMHTLSHGHVIILQTLDSTKVGVYMYMYFSNFLIKSMVTSQ